VTLQGIDQEGDWLYYRLAHHPQFLHRIVEAREALRKGMGIPLEEL
jgi:hypothetical protein